MSAERHDNWHVQPVQPTSVAALEGFVTVKFTGPQAALYQFRNGRLWKSACAIRVWDDGRVLVFAEQHLTRAQRTIVAGLAQEYWLAGPGRCKREKWRRNRRSKSRLVPSYSTCFWVQAERDEPVYAAAYADRQIVVRSGYDSYDSPSDKAMGALGRLGGA